jgi:hypothetical protein
MVWEKRSIQSRAGNLRLPRNPSLIYAGACPRNPHPFGVSLGGGEPVVRAVRGITQGRVSCY